MAVRFAAVGVAAVLVLPVSGVVPGAYAEARAPGPTPVSTSTSTSTSPATSTSTSTTSPRDGGDRELVPGVGAPDWPERPFASAASPGKSLAGRPAGEGRTRPGRAPDKSGAASGNEEEGGKASPSGSGNPSGSPGVTPSPSASGSASASASSPATPLKSHGPDPWDVHEEALEEPGNAPTISPSNAPPGAAHEGSEQVVAQSDPLGVHVLPLGAGLTLVGLGLGFLGLRLRRS
ncbi:hypothetical protein [Streptomyces sp. NPDC002994]|uniref:hypothetical protein n=1 Tax=Streptomyces sp. NPDC002994 TaxID=3154441 RepID=UPI0033B68528